MNQLLFLLRIPETCGADQCIRLTHANGSVRHWRQSGQAMPFTLAFGGAVALVTLVLFNNGMLVNAKTRLQNAADAGAYSAGVLQARDHNFSALTNRAIVANQAAVAQIVSMKSFLEDASATRERMDGALLTEEATLPVSKPMWTAGMNAPIKSVASAFNSAAPWAVEGLDRLIKAYEAAQQAHHAATALDMVLVADEVVKRNDPNASISAGAFTTGRTTLHVKQWSEYTQRHHANDDSAAADRFADVVVDANTTDQFTRFRPSSPIPGWMGQPVTVCVSAPNHVTSTTTFAFAHAGGTLLSKDKRSWVALDATLGGGIASCTFLVPCMTGTCPVTYTWPLFDDNIVGGSGGGLAGKGGYDSLTGYKNNPTQSKLYGGGVLIVPPGPRRYAEGPGKSLDSEGGLQDTYRGLTKYNVLPANQSAELNSSNAVTIEVERLEATVRTSSKVLPDSQQLKLKDGMQGGTMRALSSAQAYFYRSTSNSGFAKGGWSRSDNKTEMANLFSPYWQTRLVDRSMADRAASWAAQ
jgi:hypothetical protein